MGVILRILLVGQIALVPSVNQQGQGSLRVILPDLRNEVQHHSHIPVLLYEKRNLVNPAVYSFPDDRLSGYLHQPNGQRDFGAVILNIEKLFVRSANKGSIVFEPGEAGGVPTAETRSRFDWAPKMKSVGGGLGKITKEYYEGPSEGKVAGWLDLSGIEGHVSTFGFADVDDKVAVFEFKNDVGEGDGAAARAIADVVMVAIPLPGSEAKIGSSLGWELNLKADGQSQTIDVVLANLAPYSLDANDRVDGRHFANYFKLLSETRRARRPVVKEKLVGKRGIESDRLAPPPLLEFVERPMLIEIPREASRPGEFMVQLHGLSNRPICAEAVFEVP